jgi:hypothetical protein
MVVVAPVVSNGDLDAATKFLQLFDTIASWKAQSRTFLLDVLRPFFGDDNAVLRLKLQAAALARFVPLVTQVIRQGVAEGLFHTPYPDDIGEIVVLILTSLSEGLVVLILQEDPDVDLLPVAASRLEVSQHAIERLLGAASGSLPVMELDDLRPWFAQTRPS